MNGLKHEVLFCHVILAKPLFVCNSVARWRSCPRSCAI